MNSKKAKMIRKLVNELVSPGVDRQVMTDTMKKAFTALTHKQKGKSNLFSDHTAQDVVVDN